MRHTEEKYHERLARIAEDVNNANLTWKAGVNTKWTDADIDGVMAHCGTYLDDQNENAVRVETVTFVADNIPAEFDARV